MEICTSRAVPYDRSLRCSLRANAREKVRRESNPIHVTREMQCVCVWSRVHHAMSTGRSVSWGASVAMIRVREHRRARKRGVGGSSVQMPSVVTSLTM